jgi:hypothetical protein
VQGRATRRAVASREYLRGLPAKSPRGGIWERPLWIDVSSFIKRADDLLFRAKREGRNRVLG